MNIQYARMEGGGKRVPSEAFYTIIYTYKSIVARAIFANGGLPKGTGILRRPTVDALSR